VSGRQGPPDLLELLLRCHLLGEQCRLDAVEQPLEPPHELGLGDAELGVGRRFVLVEGQRDPLELVDQLGSQAVLELLDRATVDLREPDPAGLVERGVAHLFEELHRLSLPFTEEGIPSEAELRIAQAQLVGWLEGLFHGIQTALFAQQMAARQQLEQMRRGLPPGAGGQGPDGGLGRGTGQYL